MITCRTTPQVAAISPLLLLAILLAVRPAAPAERRPSGREPLNVAPNPSFEEDLERLGGWLPVGVVAEDGGFGIAIDSAHAFHGKRSLRITPDPRPAVTGKVFFADYNGGEGMRRVSGRGIHGARTIALRLDDDTESLAASVRVRGLEESRRARATLAAIWTTRRDRRPVVEVHRDATAVVRGSNGGWSRLELDAARPRDAIQVQIAVEIDGGEPVLADDVRIVLRRRPGARILVDQLGYERGSRTKRVVLQSSRDIAALPPARIIDAVTYRTVAEVAWKRHGLLPVWDLYHWTADFSSLTRSGRYVVALGRGKSAIFSPPFAIGDGLLEGAAAELAVRFYFHQRCGTAVPGVHAACHLDDARLPDGTTVDLAGGWHDAGDYNKYNGLTPEAVHALAFAYHRKPALFERFDRRGSGGGGNGVPDILDEALWGARWIRKMLDEETLELREAVFAGYRYWGPPEAETDNAPGTGDERPVRPGRGDPSYCVAGFALLGMHLREHEELRREGEELVALAERLHARIGGGIDRLVPLFEATGKSEYRAAARRRAAALLAGQETREKAKDEDGAPPVRGFRELAFHALAFPGDELAARVRALAPRRVAELLALCDGRFGVARRRDGGGLVYCHRYGDVNDWYVGETSTRLDAAIEGLLAAHLGDPGGREVAENQVHWILGRNPLGVSMLEGIGARFVPQYHHRYDTIPGNPRGAVPGALLNGFIRAWPHVDRPWLDLHPEPSADYHSNEPWLLHNNRWLLLLALW